jgi:hypothetical protein
MLMPQMEIFAGRMGESVGEREVKIVGDGMAGEITCLECSGTGEWSYGPTPAQCGPCLECKGTGRIPISI